MTRAAGAFAVVYAGGKTYRCTTRGRLRKALGVRVVPGDRVVVVPTGPEEGVVQSVLPRTSELVKPTARDAGRLQVLAANVDQACVVFSTASPDPDPMAVDRFLALAEAAGLVPFLCFNKLDLAEPGPLRELYESLGYRVVATSARTGQGLDRLRAQLAGHLTVLVGPSGVGKSSLVNALNPQARRKVGEVGRRGRGRHTTTDAQLIPVDGQGFVVDTPGFQVLDFVHLEPDAVRQAFPEIARLAAGCRFPDCSHRQEPGCAVREEAARGKVAASRMRSYLALLEEAEEAWRARYRSRREG
ncbi:MAG: ribosome small subunit-dependent GTPase A [Armatimonadota bacterium]|nr:ribosome small subunit-dependent GTPase A [Armatimonadota bacterium]MDW8155668.1 ribosome small subunit-dependent GTPase A [Armatimonadota bacterium]